MRKLHLPNKNTTYTHSSFIPELNKTLIDPEYALPETRTNYFDCNIIIEPPVAYVASEGLTKPQNELEEETEEEVTDNEEQEIKEDN